MAICGARCGPFKCILQKGHENWDDPNYRRHQEWGAAWSFEWEAIKPGTAYIYAKWFRDRPADWAPAGKSGPGYCYESKATIQQATREEEPE